MSATKHLIDLKVKSVEPLHSRYVLIRLTHSAPLPPMQPGQFVEIRVDGSPQTFLRRPISIHYVDQAENELWLLVATIGPGTRQLAQLKPGDTLNCLLPLGRGFRWDAATDKRILLVGGGVGVAPLLWTGAQIKAEGGEPTFLLGARSAGDLLQLDTFGRHGRVLTTTEDGSAGERGFVTQHTALQSETFDLILTCGPTPMMKAVARYAREKGVSCQASLENLMACGLGACLCCVEKTVRGNVCVCKEGPVFNIDELLWQD
ncbi:MAG: dihydroorotate dehydrogenase electron transfer subunit [Prevotella sp.]|nr:dihydroorotate dehydrogenase electron transfer subunit [Prevotella sp.]